MAKVTKAKTPDKAQDDRDEDDHNMTDSNGASGAMDEDGAQDKDAGGDPDGVEDLRGEGAPEDASPVVQNLKVDVIHPPGGILQTMITAQVHTAAGIQQKRTVLPGHVTIVRLATTLDCIDSW